VAEDETSSLLPQLKLFGDRKATLAAVRHKYGHGPE
jgi:hypothetical protein